MTAENDDLVIRLVRQAMTVEAAKRMGTHEEWERESAVLDTQKRKLREKIARLERVEQKYEEVMGLVGKLYDTWKWAVESGNGLRAGLGAITERVNDLFEFYYEETNNA